jgi:ribose 5-phosphate isomerase A
VAAASRGDAQRGAGREAVSTGPGAAVPGLGVKPPGTEGERRARDAAARTVVALVEPGMLLGLGSGRAVWRVIEEIARRRPRGAPLRAVVASAVTDARAREAGIDVVDLDGERRLDLALDGTDEVDARVGLLKGGGAALLREKLVVEAAERFVVVAEEGKRVDRLGTGRALPVEVVRFGWRDTRRRLLELVPDATLRLGPEGQPLVTDEGHLVLDCTVPPQGDVAALGVALKATTGVVEHGLFLGLADAAYLGRTDGTVEVLEARRR